MELTLVPVIGVISIVAVAVFSERLGLADPLGLVVVGMALSSVPGVPHPDLAPEWILTGVLPPLLYSAAVTMPVVDFRRDIKPITGPAVLLVVVTTLGTGWLFHRLLPGVGRPAAFALGAVISPTDAVAAMSVERRLGLPKRLLTVLEGEGLVNVRVRALLKDAVLNAAISFVIPFVPAEEFGASGVLAVVVAGVVTGHRSPRFLRAQDRLAEATNWRTLAFPLESGMFLLSLGTLARTETCDIVLA